MKLLKRLFLLPIVGYKFLISPLLPVACRFTPSCSEYAIQAIEEQGVIRGVWLAIKRLVRCNPFSHSCYDPVPTQKPHQ